MNKTDDSTVFRKTAVSVTRACWCGNTEFSPFGSDYGVCPSCGTLVSAKGLSDEALQVNNDETDFYGKRYWLDHQQDDLGFPDIHTRARRDLTERNLHWLQALLKYRLPPAQTMELGGAHGSFVALMQQAGYQASGVEVSPWVVSLSRELFGITVHEGPIEVLDIPRASLDVIALMDVLEHLPDPAATMRHCLQLLKPDGLLLVQTPRFDEEMRHQGLVESGSPFLDQLKSDEHLYLFSQRAVTEFFRRLDARHICFEPAIFSHYDMFFAVGRAPLVSHTQDEMEAALLATPNGRLALALLDVRARELDLALSLERSQADGAARGTQIDELTRMVHESELDRTERARQIESLTAMIGESELDRSRRAEQIGILTTLLGKAEAERVGRAGEIASLTAALTESELDRRRRAEQIATLTAALEESERDRSQRAEQIETLTAMLNESELDRNNRAEQIASLTAMLKESELDRSQRAEQIETLTALLKLDRNKRAERIASLTAMLEESELDRGRRAEQIATLTAMLKESELDRGKRAEQIETLTALLKESELDRGKRAEQIETLTAMLTRPEKGRQHAG